jgi:hypothetical protein
MQIAVGVDSPDVNEAIDIGERESAQEDGVDEAEYRGVGAHAEGECEDRGCGEGRAFAEEAECVAEILHYRIEKSGGAGIADGFFDLFEAAEVELGLAAGFVGSEAAGAVFVGEEIGVGAEFGVEVGLGALAAEEVSEEGGEAWEEGHDDAPLWLDCG